MSIPLEQLIPLVALIATAIGTGVAAYFKASRSTARTAEIEKQLEKKLEKLKRYTAYLRGRLKEQQNLYTTQNAELHKQINELKNSLYQAQQKEIKLLEDLQEKNKTALLLQNEVTRLTKRVAELEQQLNHMLEQNVSSKKHVVELVDADAD